MGVAQFKCVAKYPDAILPTRATKGSAGYDFYCAEDTLVPSLFNQLMLLSHDASVIFGKLGNAPLSAEQVTPLIKEYNLKPTIIPTGVKCYLNGDYYLNLAIRSSTPLKRLLILANGEGIIDKDFADSDPVTEGMIGVMVFNLLPFPQEVKKGEKIAQGIITPYGLVWDDETTASRTGGFGSTSK